MKKYLRDYEFLGRPIVRAFVVIFLWYVIFCIICIILFINTDGFNNNKDTTTYNKIIDAIYFCSTSFSTIGYGDISPVKAWSKLLTSFIQVVIIFVTFNVVVEQNKTSINNAFDNEHKIKEIVNFMKKNDKLENDKVNTNNTLRNVAKKVLLDNRKIGFTKI